MIIEISIKVKSTSNILPHINFIKININIGWINKFKLRILYKIKEVFKENSCDWNQRTWIRLTTSTNTSKFKMLQKNINYGLFHCYSPKWKLIFQKCVQNVKMLSLINRMITFWKQLYHILYWSSWWCLKLRKNSGICCCRIEII